MYWEECTCQARGRSSSQVQRVRREMSKCPSPLGMESRLWAAVASCCAVQPKGRGRGLDQAEADQQDTFSINHSPGRGAVISEGLPARQAGEARECHGLGSAASKLQHWER